MGRNKAWGRQICLLYWHFRISSPVLWCIFGIDKASSCQNNHIGFLTREIRNIVAWNANWKSHKLLETMMPLPRYISYAVMSSGKKCWRFLCHYLINLYSSFQNEIENAWWRLMAINFTSWWLQFLLPCWIFLWTNPLRLWLSYVVTDLANISFLFFLNLGK